MNRPKALFRETLVVWLAVLVVCVQIVVTYARLPARELYHVTGSGLSGGASRLLVFLNYPTALIAIGIVGLVFRQLDSAALKAAAVLAVVLSAAVFWPGVVDQADLDARPVNAIAAIGVGLALGLTVAARRRGQWPATARLSGDRVRLAVTALLLLAAPPWLAADLGFFLDDVPLLGWLYRTGAPPHNEAGLAAAIPSVHHGHHHGMDGVLLVTSALLLSRVLPAIGGSLRALSAVYLSLMLAYGAGNIANDFWLEQVVKRGWTGWEIPSVLEPRLEWAWGVIVAGAAVIWWAWFRDERRVSPRSGS